MKKTPSLDVVVQRSPSNLANTNYVESIFHIFCLTISNDLKLISPITS